MILHGFCPSSPVVTDTGCCPSAARGQRCFYCPDLLHALHHCSRRSSELCSSTVSVLLTGSSKRRPTMRRKAGWEWVIMC